MKNNKICHYNIVQLALVIYLASFTLGKLRATKQTNVFPPSKIFDVTFLIIILFALSFFVSFCILSVCNFVPCLLLPFFLFSPFSFPLSLPIIYYDVLLAFGYLNNFVFVSFLSSLCFLSLLSFLFELSHMASEPLVCIKDFLLKKQPSISREGFLSFSSFTLHIENSLVHPSW